MHVEKVGLWKKYSDKDNSKHVNVKDICNIFYFCKSCVTRQLLSKNIQKLLVRLLKTALFKKKKLCMF